MITQEKQITSESLQMNSSEIAQELYPHLCEWMSRGCVLIPLVFESHKEAALYQRENRELESGENSGHLYPT